MCDRGGGGVDTHGEVPALGEYGEFSLNGGEQSRGVPAGGSWDWFLQSLFFSFQPFNHAHKVAKYCYASKVSAPLCAPSSWLFLGEAAALGLGLASEMHFVSREAPGAFPSPRDPGKNPHQQLQIRGCDGTSGLCLGWVIPRFSLRPGGGEEPGELPPPCCLSPFASTGAH